MTIARLSTAHGAIAEKIVASSVEPASESRFFDLGPHVTLLVQAQLMARLMADPSDFEQDMNSFVASRVVSDWVPSGGTVVLGDERKVESGG
jgi:hypothetical protein